MQREYYICEYIFPLDKIDDHNEVDNHAFQEDVTKKYQIMLGCMQCPFLAWSF